MGIASLRHLAAVRPFPAGALRSGDWALRSRVPRPGAAQQPGREERDPAPADDDRDALEQTGWCSWESPVLGEDAHRQAGHEEHCHQRARSNGIGRPALPVRIAGEAPRQHEAGGRQWDEGDEAREAMDGSVEGLGAASGACARRVAQAGVGDEEAGDDQAQPWLLKPRALPK